MGKLAARALKYPFLDSDEIAQAHDGRTIAEIFDEEGEEGFRELESAVLQVSASWGLGCLRLALNSFPQETLSGTGMYATLG